MENKIWVCNNCGSTNVQVKAWINPNNHEDVEMVTPIEDEDVWCADRENGTVTSIKDPSRKVPLSEALQQIAMITDTEEDNGIIVCASTESWPWMTRDKKAYKRIEKLINKQCLDTPQYSIACFCDISGFDYWTQRETTGNYFSYNIRFTESHLTNREIQTLKSQLELMKLRVEEYITNTINNL